MPKISFSGRMVFLAVFGASLFPISLLGVDGLPEDARHPQRWDGLLFDPLLSLTAATFGYDHGSQAAPQAAAAAPAAPEPAPEPVAALFKNWTIGGFLQTAYGYNFNQPAGLEATGVANIDDKENNFRVFDVEHNDFTLQQLVLYADKAPSDDSWIGFSTRILIGQDAKFIHSAGLGNPRTQPSIGAGADNIFGDDIDLIDANLKIMIPSSIAFFGKGVITIGKFQTMHGTEVISATDNTFYSRSYLFGYAIPFTHTGIRYTQPLAYRGAGSEDKLVDMGIALVNGWDNVKDNNQGKAIMWMFGFYPCDFFNTMVKTMFSNEQNNDDHDTRGLLDIATEIKLSALPESLKPLRGLSFLLNYDYAAEEFTDNNAATDPDFGLHYSKWYGFSGIVKYQVCPKFSIAFRGEVFDDPEGVRTGVVGLGAAGAGRGDTFVELSTALVYTPWENFQFRVEHRWDKADHHLFEEHGDALDSTFQNTLSFDAIVKF
ncbi:MAG: outer membrane beta-barrel protein [Planctomycetes bacterium]|nr:outer membrane beta-barrel protein [Planctomycetota bacterium]